ncbi:hypothetical protein G5I_04802 [Acromyrmex echinatior]|uniref:Uncharacterized protein n=1 Tax=Acromyrmex echinatior TaxID=103372 RepID=F4WGM0_ACREC|nr:hypothetical protein G5I_04802 [Acromyrmex echinatior]
MAETEEEDEEEEEEEEDSVSAGGILEDPPSPTPPEYLAEAISQLFHTINELNLTNAGEYVRNADPEQFAHIRDEVFEVLEEVNFEEIMHQEIDSDEEILSDDTGYTSDLSERDTHYVESFVASSEIRALNSRTKHCIIHCYYTTTTGGALYVQNA